MESVALSGTCLPPLQIMIKYLITNIICMYDTSAYNLNCNIKYKCILLIYVLLESTKQFKISTDPYNFCHIVNFCIFLMVSKLTACMDELVRKMDG